MIKINLLPPEFRKRSASFDPLQLVTIAEVVLCAGLLAFGAYLQMVKVPAARKFLDQFTDEAGQKKIQADEVQKMQDSIKSYNDNYQVLAHLIARKVYWAHTLDDFATLLNTPLPNDGTVRCLQLSIAPSGSPKASGGTEKVDFTVSGKYQLVGELGTSSGQYVNAMFQQIQSSPFWRNHGFLGKPEDTYFGDAPQIDKKLSKLTDSFQLEFKRERVIPPIALPKAGG